MAQQPEGAELASPAPARGMPEIHAQEVGRKYRLIDLENFEIERTAAEIVLASKLLNNQNLWTANFRATIKRVRSWCDARAALIRVALVDIRSTKVMFYFVPSAGSYDLDLGDAMTDLEIELGGSAGIGPVSTLQVPARSLDQFVGPRSLSIWQLAADGPTAVVPAAVV